MDYLFQSYYEWKTSRYVTEEDKATIKGFLQDTINNNVGGKSFADRYNAWLRKNKLVKD
jgi:hypothetical protein